MSPWYIIGSLECRTCAAKDQPCNRRTDCCSDCCENGVCSPGYDNCNLKENLFTAVLIVVLAGLGVVIFAFFFIVFCHFLMQAIEERRSSTNTTDTDTENEE